MKQVVEGQREQLALEERSQEQAGCYVYCVLRTQGKFRLEVTGIQGHLVDTVVRDGLSAVIHLCPPRPYQSDASDAVAAWVLAHHQVVEAVWKRCGTVLPLRFNTILKADGQHTAMENLAAWLEAGSDWLKSKLEQFDGKAEYGIQLLRDTEQLSCQVAHSSPEIKRLEEEIARKPRGVAYMHRQKLEAMLKRGIETRVVEEYQVCYTSISQWADAIHVERLRPPEGKSQMLMNLSCLVSAERYPGLAKEMDHIGATEGFSFRLVGPMPPYSFC